MSVFQHGAPFCHLSSHPSTCPPVLLLSWHLFRANWRLVPNEGQRQHSSLMDSTSNFRQMGRVDNEDTARALTKQSPLGPPRCPPQSRPIARHVIRPSILLGDRNSSNGQDRGPQGADTLVPVKTHQRRGLPAPDPLSDWTAPVSTAAPVSSVQATRNRRQPGTRVPGDLYFAPLPRGMAFSSSTPPSPPQQFGRALCIAAPRTLHARPTRAQRGVSEGRGKYLGPCGCEALRPLSSRTRRWGLKYIIQKPPPSSHTVT